MAPDLPHSSWDLRARRWLADPRYRRARGHLEATDARTLAEQAGLAAIPAPSFAEAERGRSMAELMRDSGIETGEPDAVGNVVGWFRGSAPWSSAEGGPPPIVISAHLDTVFSAETPIAVQRKGDLLRAPGIADDARGLAALLALARAARAGGLRFETPLLVVATVGEEGAGDLHGVRHLFSDGGLLPDGCAAFLSLDGAGIGRIVTRGVGSLRYRAILRGPGGHSWIDHGTPNPMHALARAIEALLRIPLSRVPRTTFSVGRWGGGTSVNSIPTEAWAEFEVRSEGEVELSRMDLEIRSVLDRVPLALELERLGRRPAGHTAPDHPVVESALAATRTLGVTPVLDTSSTDANLPMSLGIPAITLGAGGRAGQLHTPDEWFRNVQGPDGIARALLTLLLLDGR